MYREMNSISQHQNRLFEKLGAQIKSLDLTFDGVIDDLNGIKDMFIIMESLVVAVIKTININIKSRKPYINTINLIFSLMLLEPI